MIFCGRLDVEEALSKYIAEHAPSEDDLVDGTSASASNAPIVWADETKLPSDIRLDVTDEQLAAGLKQLSWKRLFLTGATGYLGAFMLADLLALPEQPLVSCLIRCKSEDEGLSRLKAALSKYSILINEGTPALMFSLLTALSHTNLDMQIFGSELLLFQAIWSNRVLACRMPSGTNWPDHSIKFCMLELG